MVKILSFPSRKAKLSAVDWGLGWGLLGWAGMGLLIPYFFLPWLHLNPHANYTYAPHSRLCVAVVRLAPKTDQGEDPLPPTNLGKTRYFSGPQFTHGHLQRG